MVELKFYQSPTPDLNPCPQTIELLEEIARFVDEVTIVERATTINLTCDEPPPHTEVTWKIDGEPIQASRLLTLEDVDQPNAGNYTCWQNGTLVKHTYLVVSEKDRSPIFSNAIQCRARTFDSAITCSWQTRGAAIFQVKYCRRVLRNPESNCSFIECSKSGTDHHCHFTVKNYSPYEEEYNPITFFVEAISSVSHQKMQKTFYMENIVKPDPPKNITVTLNKHKKMIISWEYPCDWIKPHSYFPLRFEIEYTSKKENGTEVVEEGLSKEIKVSARRYMVRIKAKDRFLNSPWSEWSAWINSRNVRV
ncbi:interleukin-12 subunit beta-like [Scyliorhinus torazame]|uniref:interleukin-12 subunit beta-like n=1 Tax=Scyliorhinus torazame TaxID=75743 RepID=UPI003B591486